MKTRWSVLAVVLALVVFAIPVWGATSGTEVNPSEEWRVHPGCGAQSGYTNVRGNVPLISYCQGLNDATVTVVRGGSRLYQAVTVSVEESHWFPRCPGYMTDQSVLDAALAGWVTLPKTLPGDKVVAQVAGSKTVFRVPDGNYAKDIYVCVEDLD